MLRETGVQQAQGSTPTATIREMIHKSKVLYYRAVIPDAQAPNQEACSSTMLTSQCEATEPQKDNSATHHCVLNLSAECHHHICWSSLGLWLFNFKEELA